MMKMRTVAIWLAICLPLGILAQSDSTTTVPYNPLEVEVSLYGHSLFGDAIDQLPEKMKLGYGIDLTAKYRIGEFGLALSGGYWRVGYEPMKAGVDYTIRQNIEDHIGAHYIMFGPYYSADAGKFSVEINPKVGVQRFYFPHFVGRSTVNGNMGQVVERTRTDFDAGISLGLGLKARVLITDDVAVHARLDYMSTVGSESFKYIYTSPGNRYTNSNPLQSISFGVGASMAIPGINQKQKSFAPSALEVGLGAGLNFLTGKGINNLPGNKSVGYITNLNLDYRIGKSGIALMGGNWENEYERPGIATRLDVLGGHHISAGPIIPLASLDKVNIEVVPHAGIDRIYFPHTPSNPNRVTTNLRAGWTAGLMARAAFPVSPVLDFRVSADFTSMLTDRGFGFTARGANAVTNRSPLQRVNIGANLAYKLLKKVEEVEMTPDEIQELIDAKEDDMDSDMDKDGVEDTDMQVGGDGDKENMDEEGTPTETMPSDPKTGEPATTMPSTTDPNTTNPSSGNTTTVPSTTAPTTTYPSTTYPSTTSPTYTSPTTTYVPPTVYRVQFVALSKDVKVFNELKQYGTVILEYYSAKGLYRYMVGDALSEEEGLLLLDQIHRNGWPKAFLVKYKDGVRTRVR